MPPVWQRLRESALVRGLTGVLAIQVAGVGANLVLQVLLARVMGATSYGAFVNAFRWMTVLVIVGRLGLDTVALRFASAYAAASDWPRLRGLIRASVAGACGGGLATAIIAMLVVRLIGLAPDLRTTFDWALASLPLLAVLHVSGALVRAQKAVTAALVPATLVRPGLTVLAVLGLAAMTTNSVVPAMAMAINLGATALAAGLGLALLLARTPAETRIVGMATPATFAAREWIAVALPMTLLNLVMIGVTRTDILVLGALVPAAEVGRYAAAARVAMLIPFGLQALDTWIAPRIAELHAGGRTRDLQRLLRQGALATLAYSAPIAVVAIGWGRELLGLFGQEFTDGYPILAILAAGHVVSAALGPVGIMMTMTGQQTPALWILGSATLASVPLSIACVHWRGAEGAAIATTVVRIAATIAMASVAWRRLRLRATVV